MEIYPTAQALLALYCAALGAAVGVLADVSTELCRRLPKHVRGVLRFVTDLCCVGVAFCGIIVLSFYFDKGRIRFFDFLGATVGFLIYRVVFSRPVRLIFSAFMGAVLRVLRLLGIPCVFLLKKITKSIKICQFYIRKSLEKCKYMLYNIYNNIIILKWARYGFILKNDKKTIGRKK